MTEELCLTCEGHKKIYFGRDEMKCPNCKGTGYRPKAEPPEWTPHEVSIHGKDEFGHEPKASPSLEDAARAFANAEADRRGMDIPFNPTLMANFARQQRREAVAEFVRRVEEEVNFRWSSINNGRQVYQQVMQAVSKGDER